jgi:hypothetical protein
LVDEARHGLHEKVCLKRPIKAKADFHRIMNSSEWLIWQLTLLVEQQIPIQAFCQGYSKRLYISCMYSRLLCRDDTTVMIGQAHRAKNDGCFAHESRQNQFDERNFG